MGSFPETLTDPHYFSQHISNNSENSILIEKYFKTYTLNV